MRVLHLGTDDCAGGAARAMYRWHTSLRKLDVASQILCLNKSSDDQSVFTVLPNWEKQSTFEHGLLQRFFIESNRTDFSGTFFSHPLGYTSVADHELVQCADVIHVHWTSLFFNWEELRRVKALGKFLVLTPHDLWPVTGGCHYPWTCDGYLKECRDCPMLTEDPFSLVPASRTYKQSIISEVVDLILSPSGWMDESLAKVEALKSVPRGVVPYCVDVAQFPDESKERVKQELQFDPRRKLILFSAANVTERRKGINQLSEVLKICENRPEFRKVLEEDVEFALIGKGSDQAAIPTTFRLSGRGFVAATADLCRYYFAADLLIYLGLEDNLPNVILEAMACGTPVLAFNTGGAGDLITDGETGELIERGDLTNFALRLSVLLANPGKLAWFGLNCREKALRQFSERAVGLRLRRVYEKLTARPLKFGLNPVSPSGDVAFQSAVPATIRAAMKRGYRSMEQEFLALKAHRGKDQEEIGLLRRYLHEAQADVLKLHEALRQERAALEQERIKTLWQRVKEKIPRFR